MALNVSAHAFPSQRQRARRWSLAAAGALGLHLAFAALFAFQLAPRFAPPRDQGSAIAVSLMRGALAQAAAAPAEVDALSRRIAADAQAEIPTQDKPQHRAPQDLMKLFDAIARDAQPADATPGDGGAGGAEVVDPRALASELTSEAVDHTVLWPQVTRCWKPVPGAAPVALLVRLDDAGNVLGPVVVFRRGQNASRDLEGAEDQASRAVRECAPYHLSSLQPRAFELVF
jgi:hypothetical protein